MSFQMLEVHTAVHGIDIEGKRFLDLCETVSIADIFQAKKRRRREVKHSIDLSS